MTAQGDRGRTGNLRGQEPSPGATFRYTSGSGSLSTVHLRVSPFLVEGCRYQRTEAGPQTHSVAPYPSIGQSCKATVARECWNISRQAITGAHRLPLKAPGSDAMEPATGFQEVCMSVLVNPQGRRDGWTIGRSLNVGESALCPSTLSAVRDCRAQKPTQLGFAECRIVRGGPRGFPVYGQSGGPLVTLECQR